MLKVMNNVTALLDPADLVSQWTYSRLKSFRTGQDHKHLKISPKKWSSTRTHDKKINPNRFLKEVYFCKG